MTTFPERFEEFLIKQCLVEEKGKMLLAVSGGIDSVVMLHLFHKVSMPCEVAHCNFQLRAEDSDEDEHFVKALAHQYNFALHTKRFDTAEFARENSVSIQMAARKLRYRWFDELVTENRFQAVAVAHHANDVAETMLLNLVKGTGLAGMHGIRAVNGIVIRPLLFATKKELESYASEHRLAWREDASNSEVYYQRNKIRHEVIPVLEQINPQIAGALLHHARLVEGYEAVLGKYIAELASELCRKTAPGITSVLLKPLLESAAPGILLYHLLKPYGVNSTLCEEILSTVHTGAVFYSNGYKLVRDRKELTIFEPHLLSDDEYHLPEKSEPLDLPFGQLEVSAIDLQEPARKDKLPNFADTDWAYVDADRIRFPLLIRKWRQGDFFQPLGMHGKKLLSDFFIDSRFSSGMKEIVYLLLSEGEIVWVMGHRISERFKVTDTTRKILRLHYKPREITNGENSNI